VRRQVGTAIAQPPSPTRQDQFRADAVGRSGEQPALVERVEPGEGAETERACGRDRRAKPLDDGFCRGQ
jgi:hypothetical protein